MCLKSEQAWISDILKLINFQTLQFAGIVLEESLDFRQLNWFMLKFELCFLDFGPLLYVKHV